MYTKFFSKFVRFAGFLNGDTFAISEGTYLPKARNMVHNAALEKKLPLMMLDSDILFPPNIAQTLYDHKLPIVGGWYLDKFKKQPTVYDFVSEEDGISHYKNREQRGSGLEKVDAMGAGCWLMSYEVVKALGENPYDMNSGGEDMVVCRKLQKLGIPLHVDWNLNCAHLGVFYV
jgi:hypothetical protein